MLSLITLCLNILLSWYLTKLVIKPFKNLIPDHPKNRSAHKIIKPRGGGLTFISSNLFIASIFGQPQFLILLPLSFISLLDDFLSISRLLRFSAQFLTSFLIFFSSDYFTIANTIENLFIKITIIFLIIITCTAIINFFNFMDGIDGILTGSFIVILISSNLIIGGYIWGLIGSLIGFLIWNWSPSKIFMGDVGSNFLGGVMIWLIFQNTNFSNSIGIIFIAFPLLIDPLTCLLRRILNKENFLKPHSKHLYQRLLKADLSHGIIALIYILSSTVISLSYFLGGLKLEILSCIIIFILGLWLDHKYAIPYKKIY